MEQPPTGDEQQSQEYWQQPSADALQQEQWQQAYDQSHQTYLHSSGNKHLSTSNGKIQTTISTGKTRR